MPLETLFVLAFAVSSMYGTAKYATALHPLTWPGIIATIAGAALTFWLILRADLPVNIAGIAGLGLCVAAGVIGILHGTAKRAARLQLHR